MSEVGLERGIAGLPAVQPQFTDEIGNDGSTTTVSSSGSSPATGLAFATVGPFYTDGDTTYEITVSAAPLYGAATVLVTLFENGGDMGIMLRSFSFHNVERTRRRKPARGPVIYQAVLWVFGGGTGSIDGTVTNPSRLNVRRVGQA